MIGASTPIRVTMTLSEYLVLLPAGLAAIGLVGWLAGALHERIAKMSSTDAESEAASSAG